MAVAWAPTNSCDHSLRSVSAPGAAPSVETATTSRGCARPLRRASPPRSGTPAPAPRKPDSDRKWRARASGGCGRCTANSSSALRRACAGGCLPPAADADDDDACSKAASPTPSSSSPPACSADDSASNAASAAASTSGADTSHAPRGARDHPDTRSTLTARTRSPPYTGRASDPRDASQRAALVEAAARRRASSSTRLRSRRAACRVGSELANDAAGGSVRSCARDGGPPPLLGAPTITTSSPSAASSRSTAADKTASTSVCNCAGRPSLRSRSAHTPATARGDTSVPTGGARRATSSACQRDR